MPASTLPSVSSITWDDIYTSSKYTQPYESNVVDLVSKSDPLFEKLRAKADKRDNTAPIDVPVRYHIPDATFYSGDDEVDNAQEPQITKAIFGWCRAALAVKITDEDEDRNRGGAQILNLLETRYDGAYKGMINSVISKLYAANTSVKYPLGLPDIIQTVPTADPTCGAIGGITRVGTGDLAVAWRNQTINFNASLSTLTLGDMWELVRTAKGNGVGLDEEPDMILMNDREFDKVWNLIETKHSFVSTGMNGGYAGIIGPGRMVINNTECFRSPYMTAGTIYAINTKYLHLAVVGHRDMVWDSFWRIPPKQMARTKYLHFVFQLLSDNPQRLAVMYGIV